MVKFSSLETSPFLEKYVNHIQSSTPLILNSFLSIRRFFFRFQSGLWVLSGVWQNFQLSEQLLQLNKLFFQNYKTLFRNEGLILPTPTSNNSDIISKKVFHLILIFPCWWVKCSLYELFPISWNCTCCCVGAHFITFPNP